MRLLFENFRKYLNEDFTDDVIDALEKTPYSASEEERRHRAATWQQNPPAAPADWKKFKQWKEKDPQPPEQPEDYEKALEQHVTNKSENILQYNCETFIKYLELERFKMLSCDNIKNATQGLKGGQGSPSQIFKNSKFVKIIGHGGFGVAALFDNSHIVKIFHGGVGAGKENPLKGELEGYEKLLSSQFAGSAKSYDLTVYEFGTIPTTDPSGRPGTGYIGYAEMGKVIPFSNWVKEKYNEGDAEDITNFLWYDLATGLDEAQRARKVKNFDQVEGGPEEYIDYIMNGDSESSAEGGFGEKVDPRAPTQPAIDPRAPTQRAPGWDRRGDARSSWPTRSTPARLRESTLAKRVEARRQMASENKRWEGIKNGGLSNVSQFVVDYGWRTGYRKEPDYDEMKPIPSALTYGLGKKFLHSLLTAVYRASKLNGGEYLYGPQTSDVHEGNFGISYQTGEVIIFDR